MVGEVSGWMLGESPLDKCEVRKQIIETKMAKMKEYTYWSNGINGDSLQVCSRQHEMVGILRVGSVTNIKC